MKRQLFTLVALLLIGCTTTVWGQTDLSGRIYHHPNVLADKLNEATKDVNKEQLRQKGIAKAEKKKGRKLTAAEKAEIDKKLEKTIKTIEAMKKADEQGMFEGGSYGNSMDYSMGSIRMPYPHMMYNRPMYGSYDSYDGNSMARAGRDGDGDGRYSEDYSNRRGRGADGRYVSRDGGSYDGYSGHENKEELKRKIQEMQQRLNNM